MDKQSSTVDQSPVVRVAGVCAEDLVTLFSVCDDSMCSAPSESQKFRTDFRVQQHLHSETASIQDPNCRVLRCTPSALPPNRHPGHIKAREPVAERPAQALVGALPTCGRDSGDRADVQPAGRAQALLL